MAQSSGSNLSISIGADSSKLQVDLKTALALIRKFTSDLNAAVKAGDAGRIAIAQQDLQSAIRQRDQLSAATTRLKVETKAAAAAEIELANATKTTQGVFGRFGSDLASIASSFRLLRAGVIGIAAEKGIELIKRLGEEVFNVADRIRHVQRTAAATGFDTTFVQLFRQAVKDAGGDIQDADKALYHLGNTIADARIEAEKAGVRGIGAGVAVLTGNAKSAASEMVVLTNRVTAASAAVTVFRGTAQALPDFEHPLKALGVDIGAPPRKQAEQAAAGLVGFAQAGREDYASFFARQVFGAKSYREIAPTVTGLTEPKLAELERRMRGQPGQFLGPEEFKRAEDFNKVAGETKDTVEGISTQKFVAAMPTAQASLVEFRKGLLEVNKIPAQITKGVEDIGNASVAAGELVTKNLGDAFSGLVPLVKGVAAQIAKTWNETVGTLRVPGGGGGGGGGGGAGMSSDSPAAALPFAGGGHVSGPGSGTSDSILARLSAGEFVVNARSVRALGPALLDGINSFAMGGLVGVPSIRFAEGGLVGAGSAGQPVHLHLGSQSFELSGSPDVVGAMVTAAHSQQISSAGVKPSWYAARPGGR
jgi:uncharacterized protein (UPF0335 family)